MIPAKPFYMIRHGETEANKAFIVAGQTETPLTGKGRDQARSVQPQAKALEVPPTTIIHSNLSRARDTASIINEALNLPMHEDPNFAELSAGDQESAPYEECMGFLNGFETPVNGESFESFFERIRIAMTDTLESYDTPVLIACHGGVFRALGGIYGLKVLKVIDNCRLCEFQPNPDKSPFPWDVFAYEYDEEQQKIIRVEETMYNGCKLFGDD